MVALMDNDARTTARRYYAACGRSLRNDLAALAGNRGAAVVWTPQLVALLLPVDSARAETWEELPDSPEGADAWYVHLLAGDLALARRMASALAPLPRLCFRRGLRNPVPHIYLWRQFVQPSA